MNTTQQRTLTISLSRESLLRKITAASAALLLTSPTDEQHCPLVTSDHRALVNAFVDEAFIVLAGRLSAFISTDIPDSTEPLLVFTLTLPADSTVAASVLRHIAEQALTDDVLSRFYAADSNLATTFVQRRDLALARLCLLCAGRRMSRPDCWL